jgi:hypothetical protein
MLRDDGGRAPEVGKADSPIVVVIEFRRES